MSKTKKIKAFILVMIFALSIILIVLGAIMNDEGGNDSSSEPQEVYLNQNFSIVTDSTNYTVEFTPTSTGYYSIFVDGARLTYMIEAISEYTTSLTHTSTNVYYNHTDYDYKYLEYLYSGTTYYLKTNSGNGYHIAIYITR